MMKGLAAIALVCLLPGVCPGTQGPQAEFACPAGTLVLPGEMTLSTRIGGL